MMIDTRKDEDGLHEVKKWPLYLTDDQVATLMDTSSVAWLADEDSWTQVGSGGSCYNYTYMDGRMHSLELFEDGSVEAVPIGTLPKKVSPKTYLLNAVAKDFEYETTVPEDEIGDLIQSLLKNDSRSMSFTVTELI